MAFIFSPALKKMLDIVRIMQTPTLGRFCIQKKYRAQFSLKFGPGSGSGL